MKRIPRAAAQFFEEQGCVIVSSIDRKGSPHNSCKGIVKIDPKGRVYLMDLYRAATYRNIRRNKNISITAFDEHRFKGYCLKGRAKIVATGEIPEDILKAWEVRINSRLTQRVIRNIRGEKGGSQHPEAFLPRPNYVIMMEAGEIVDLRPRHLRDGG